MPWRGSGTSAVLGPAAGDLWPLEAVAGGRTSSRVWASSAAAIFSMARPASHKACSRIGGSEYMESGGRAGPGRVSENALACPGETTGADEAQPMLRAGEEQTNKPVLRLWQ